MRLACSRMRENLAGLLADLAELPLAKGDGRVLELVLLAQSL